MPQIPARGPLIALLLFASVALLAGCGAATQTPPAATPSTPAPSSSVAGGSPRDYVITTQQLPPGGTTWQQIVDQTLNGDAASDQRAWQNATNTRRVEVDVLLNTSTSAAQRGYASWAATIKQRVAQVSSSPPCPQGVGGPGTCDETTGVGSDAKGYVVITWQSGRVLAAAFLVDVIGPTAVDQAYLENVASAESGRISTLIGA